jgi:hypothetical protein
MCCCCAADLQLLLQQQMQGLAAAVAAAATGLARQAAAGVWLLQLVTLRCYSHLVSPTRAAAWFFVIVQYLLSGFQGSKFVCLTSLCSRGGRMCVYRGHRPASKTLCGRNMLLHTA